MRAKGLNICTGNTRRAIDLREGERIDEKALKALIRAAVALNTAAPAAARPVLSEESNQEEISETGPRQVE